MDTCFGNHALIFYKKDFATKKEFQQKHEILFTLSVNISFFAKQRKQFL